MKSSLRIWLFTLVVLAVPTVAYIAYSNWEGTYAELPIYGPVTEVDGQVSHHRIPDFEFVNQEGIKYALSDIEGKIAVVDFFFSYCPSICPKMTRNIQDVAEKYANEEDLQFISFSVDPERDTPARLAEFAEMYHADSEQWNFLTGDKRELYHLARKGFFLSATDGDGGPNDFIHSENIVLIDRQGQIRGYYNGTDELAIRDLIRDITKLKKEKV